MKYVITILALISLTGCASSVNLLAEIYDSADDCQKTYLIKTGQYPSYCGGSKKALVIRDYPTNRPVYTIK